MRSRTTASWLIIPSSSKRLQSSIGFDKIRLASIKSPSRHCPPPLVSLAIRYNLKPVQGSPCFNRKEMQQSNPPCSHTGLPHSVSSLLLLSLLAILSCPVPPSTTSAPCFQDASVISDLFPCGNNHLIRCKSCARLTRSAREARKSSHSMDQTRSRRWYRPHAHRPGAEQPGPGS